jgi:hypothetical protein
MALRFITTELFEDAWFMDLPAKYKLFWIYLITRCDHSGIWQVNWKLAQFYTGDNLEPTEVLRLMKNRIVEIDSGKYWFIPKFIQFQYKGEINESNPAHYKIIDNIKKYNLLDFLEKTQIIKGAKKGLKSPTEGDKVKDKVMVKVKPSLKEVKEYFEGCGYPKDQAESFWSTYESQGWETKSGAVIKNWQAKVIGWMNNSKQFGNNNGTDKGQITKRRKDYVTKDEYESELKSLLEGGSET